MFPLIFLCFALPFPKRGSLILENLVLRQQLAVLKNSSTVVLPFTLLTSSSGLWFVDSGRNGSAHSPS